MLLAGVTCSSVQSVDLDDFRIPIATHVELIWMQLFTADSRGCSLSRHSLHRHLKQPLWGEILPSSLTAVPLAHPMRRSRDRCVATDYVGNLFEWIFGQGLEVINSTTELFDAEDEDECEDEEGQEGGHHNQVVQVPILEPKESKTLSDTSLYAFHHEEYGKAMYPRYTTGVSGRVKVGDVVELGRGEGTRWTSSTKNWYAYVSDRWTTSKGTVKLKILWLYWPEDIALCMSMKYPYQNEVPLSSEINLMAVIF